MLRLLLNCHAKMSKRSYFFLLSKRCEKCYVDWIRTHKMLINNHQSIHQVVLPSVCVCVHIKCANVKKKNEKLTAFLCSSHHVWRCHKMHEIMKMRSIIDCLEFRDFPGSSSILNLIDYWPVKVPKFFMEYFKMKIIKLL